MSTQEVQSPTAAAHAEENGGTSSAGTDSELLTLLDKEIAARKARVDELRAELAGIEPELKRYERVRAMLTGAQPEKRTGRPKSASQTAKTSRMGDARVAVIRDAVLRYAKDHEEFRQVDIRAITGEGSSPMALAFERMRQEGVIRFARQEGNNKWFRLTREAARELS